MDAAKQNSAHIAALQSARTWAEFDAAWDAFSTDLEADRIDEYEESVFEACSVFVSGRLTERFPHEAAARRDALLAAAGIADADYNARRLLGAQAQPHSSNTARLWTRASTHEHRPGSVWQVPAGQRWVN